MPRLEAPGEQKEMDRMLFYGRLITLRMALVSDNPAIVPGSLLLCFDV